MAGTIMVSMFWISNKLKETRASDLSTQTKETKIDVQTQVERKKVAEKSTQTFVPQTDGVTQMEKIPVDSKYTQTAKQILLDKDVQVSVENLSKSTQTSPHTTLDKNLEIEASANSMKLTGPDDKTSEKSKIPVTAQYQKYLERKNYVHSDEKQADRPEFWTLLSRHGIEVLATNGEEDIKYLHSGADENTASNIPVVCDLEYSHGYFELGDDKEKPNVLSQNDDISPPDSSPMSSPKSSEEFTNFFSDGEDDIKEFCEDIQFLAGDDELATDEFYYFKHEYTAANRKLKEGEEKRFVLSHEVTAGMPSETRFSKSGEDGLLLLAEGNAATSTSSESVSWYPEQTLENIGLKEGKEKQNAFSRFKNQLQKFKKFFKK